MSRRHRPPEPPRVEDCHWSQVLTWEGEPVLSLSLCWPALPGDGPDRRRINRYYQRISDRWKSRWLGTLYPRAQEAARLARAASRPFRPWSCALTCTLTRQTEDLLSLRLDICERTDGTRTAAIRLGDTWSLPEGTPRALASFFPPHSRWRARILAELRRQIRARVQSGEALFADDWETLLPRRFDPERFCLTDEGLCVFFPLYAIAPYTEGIPTFTLPLPAPVAEGSSG